ncbi:MAG TPA: hypothetical protein VK827_07690 [Lysobacter sp.]|nr:hypothetical protein [Lysobacter sp.]
MSNARSTRRGARAEQAPPTDYVPESLGPPLKDPRSRAAIDNIGVDDQGDLLDVELDEQPGDIDSRGRSFTDDVRSDSGDDERREGR